MGSLFRSEEMCLAQLFLQAGTAYQCVGELGEIGLVEFRDLNQNINLFQRRFVGEIRRCEELERTFSYLNEEVKRSDLQLQLTEGADLSAPPPKDVLTIQEESETLQQELKEVSRNWESLSARLTELQEYAEVLRETRQFTNRGQMPSPRLEPRSGDREPLLDPSVSQNLEAKLSFVAGVVHPWKVAAFERLLWRACCGYIIINFAEMAEPMEDPTTGEMLKQVTFLISYWGEQIGQKVKKICDCYHCHVFPYPSGPEDQQEALESLLTRIEDMKSVLHETEEYLKQVLQKVVGVLHPWAVRIRKMKAIYLILNQCNFDVTGKCLIAEVWCPRSDLQKLRQALEEGSRKSGASAPSFYNQIPTSQAPPTLNRTNRFTSGFQGIVDAYGVGNYQEVNPAPYTIITFPFLFAVMFGDVGHGLIIALFAAWMVLNEEDPKLKKEQSEIWKTLFGGRYIILLMGLFSVYTGLIYNDCFSQSISIFPSAWNVKPMFTNDKWEFSLLNSTPFLSLDPNVSSVFEGVYPFGIDPIWQLATNKLNFLNSYKMKMSVIVGIIHMCFGVTLGIFNYTHFKKGWYVLLVFLPEMIFLLSLFGYLVFLIVYKWLRYSVSDSKDAPSILIHFIDMFLFTSSPSNAALYPGQQTVQILLVIVALWTIIVLLIGKPLYLYCQHKFAHRTPRSLYRSLQDESDTLMSEARNDTDWKDQRAEEQFDTADVFMKQAIHTIEYCLSCISNTASYLRLWALSLAHAQLAEVLWAMVLRQGLNRTDFSSSVDLFAAFAFFAALTVAILLVMEGLSAFLHALRLHWVEFQNKFYSGCGYKFLPFCFCLFEDDDAGF